jgi:uncharacterized flavoprotein (TIGR03862 family)
MPNPSIPPNSAPQAVVVGGGPAGLMAAEVLAEGGARVALFDAMPSVGRKFLLAGKGGLNLTHAEDFEAFAARYGAGREHLEPMLRRFGPQALRDWAAGLGIHTFVGSSGRVFPSDMKAAPLLRAWLHRLRAMGVGLHMRHRCIGLDATALRFDTPQGPAVVPAAAVVLALGGASWPQLGSDGTWVPWLQALGVPLTPLRSANCGFVVAAAHRGGHGWSELLISRHAGAALKSVAIEWTGADGAQQRQAGEFVLTPYGIEGSLVYAAAAALRGQIEAAGSATLRLDLLPARSLEWVSAELMHPRGSRSLATHLKTRLGLHGVKAALLHELLPKADLADPARLAVAIKALLLRLTAPRPIAEAISSAGGVRFDALDDGLMLRALPGVFCAGEMLDWEAPTGGYLLSACFASGRAAGQGALRWLGRTSPGGAGGVKPPASPFP